MLFALLFGCSSFEQITDIKLSRISQMAVGGTTYSAMLASEGGCRSGTWLGSTLGGLEPAAVSSQSRETDNVRDPCQELGIAWSDTEALDALEQVPLIFQDRVSSYPVLLGNWPTALRTLQAVDPLGGESLSGRTVQFVLDGPGVIDPELQVSLLTADTLWLIPEEGGQVSVAERSMEITFPDDVESPIELRIEAAWPVEVLQNEMAVEVGFAEGDDGQVFAL